MRWDQFRRSDNIEDSRGAGPHSSAIVIGGSRRGHRMTRASSLLLLHLIEAANAPAPRTPHPMPNPDRLPNIRVLPAEEAAPLTRHLVDIFMQIDAAKIRLAREPPMGAPLTRGDRV